MMTKEPMTKAITQLYQASLAAIIPYIAKYQKLASVATLNNFLVIMPMWKPSAKFFIYVPTTRPTISFVRMELSSISNFLFAYGGISLIAILHQVYTI